MKIVIEFDGHEDRSEAAEAVLASKAWCALRAIDQAIRSRLEYGDDRVSDRKFLENLRGYATDPLDVLECSS